VQINSSDVKLRKRAKIYKKRILGQREREREKRKEENDKDLIANFIEMANNFNCFFFFTSCEIEI
jgi:hypothetical protein